MQQKLKISIRLLSSFLATLFVFYVYPAWVLASEPAVTEAIIGAEPDGEPITEDELESLREYYAEEYKEPDVIGEQADLRDASIKHYRMSDGTFRAVDYGKDVHYKNESDEWTDFDNDLVLNENVDSADSEDFAGYEPKENDAKIKFAKNTSSSNLLKIKYEDFQVSFGLRGANKSTPTIENGELDPNDPYALPNISSKVTYPDVFNGVDLVYIVDGSNVKEYFVISKEAEVFEYTFDIKVKNVTPSVDEEGNVVFTKEDGSVAYTIPKGYMYDSGTGYSENVTYTVEQVKNKKYTLTVTADKEWIAAEERVYPVMVDPTVVLNKYAGALNSEGITVQYKVMPDGTPMEYTDHIYVGTSSGEVNNIYLKVPNIATSFALPSNTILCNAYFMLRQLDPDDQDDPNDIGGYSTNGPDQLYIGAYEPKSSTDIYNPSSTLLDYAVYSNDTCGTFSQIDVTPAARKWYSDSSANNGIVLHAINNTATSYANARFVGCYSSDSELAFLQPRFIISYRHTVGIEGYYTYETLDMDRAGTLYLNVNTGQTVVVNDVITTNNLAVPYTVSLVYNSVYARTEFTNNDAADIHTADYSNMKLGAGWKLNSQMSVVEKDLKSFITGIDVTYLVFCDGDGTEHYFAPPTDNSNIYKDEDGLGLQIEVLDDDTYGKYRMTDDKGNVTMFSHLGYILDSTDSNGNVIRYNYDIAGDKRKLMNITVTNYGGYTKKVAEFTYDSSNYLTSIKDQYGRVTTLGYNTRSPLEFDTITYPDGNTAIYHYITYEGFNNTNRKLTDIGDDESAFYAYLLYETDGNKVSEIREYAYPGTEEYGSRLSMTYNGSERTTVTYSGNDGSLNTSDDIANVYHFDYFGRCTNVHTMDPTTYEVYGSSVAAYTSSDSETSKQRNKINTSAVTGVQPVNMLVNAGAELLYSESSNIASWFYRPSLSTGQSVERSTAYSHTGVASMKVSATTAPTSGLHTYYIFTGLTVGKTYTFSAYAKAVDFNTTTTDGGYYLRVGSEYSARLNKDGNTSSDNGWIKLSVTFDATTTGNTYLYAGFVGATGTVYFDDFQLAAGADTDQISLISDGGFEHTNTDDWAGTWAENGVISEYDWSTSAGNYNSTYHVSGGWSFQILGSPLESKCASMRIPINKSGAYTYVYSGWAYAISVPTVLGDKTNKPTFCLSAQVVYTDGNDEWHSKAFSADYKSWWQYISMPIAPKETTKTVEYIKLFVAYDYNGNDVVFDSFSLVADNATCYEYDDNGNVTAANSTNTSEVTATYSGADLTGYTAATGAEYTYGYDNKHNVTSASWAGVTNTYAYNSAGLVTGSYLRNGSSVIATTAAYDGYGKLTSETDQLGNTTSYEYNSNNGALELNIFPDNSRMVYRTTVSNNRPYQVYYDVPGTGYESTVNLSYSNGRLSQINQLAAGSEYSQIYNLSYNNFGDLTSLTVGDITLSQNTYNQYTGALMTSLTPGGTTLNYNYDKLGRLTGVLNGSTSIASFDYNSRGNISSLTDVPRSTVTTFLYDSIGRQISELKRNTSNVFKQMVSYTYDDASRVTNRAYNFDFYGGNLSDKFTYDTNGLLSKMIPANGDNIIPEYNGLKQVDRIKVEHNNSSNYTYYKDYAYKTVSGTRTSNLPVNLSYFGSDGTTSLLTYSYNYDNMNRITAVTKNNASESTETYVYDEFGKLSEADIENNSYSYSYDATGNISGIVRVENGKATITRLYYDTTSGWYDRLIKVGSTDITYSDTAPGLPVSYYNGKNSFTFTWDDQGRLYSTTANSKPVAYQYDINGLRTFKRYGINNYYFYYDGDRLLAQKWGSKNIHFYYDENDSIYSFSYYDGSSYSKYYLFKNLQGDVVEIRNNHNEIVANYLYDPYGNIISITDANGNDISADTTHIAYINPIRYRSYYYDVETGFYYLQSRYYDPAIGRFISADDPDFLGAVDNPASLNLFIYCMNNPVNMSDEGGNLPWFVASAITGALFDTAVYLIGSAISGEEISLKGVGKAALAGAISGVALGAIGKGVKAVSSTIKATKAAKYTTGTINQIGKIGEKISGIIKNNTKYFVNGRWRIPDGITKKFVQEVKNVKSLSLTSQLKDSIQLAQNMGKRMELFIRPDTYLSGPLKQAIKQYNIKVTYLW